MVELLLAQLPFILESRTGGGCVTDGPFAKLEIRLGPGPRTGLNKRCLNRDFAPTLLTESPLLGVLEALPNVPTYTNATGLINVPHGTGHGSIGGLLGEMFNLFSSPNGVKYFIQLTINYFYYADLMSRPIVLPSSCKYRPSLVEVAGC